MQVDKKQAGKKDNADGRSTTEKLQNPENLRIFNEQISSLIIAMKPKISHMYFHHFTKEMVKQFFRQLRKEMQQKELKVDVKAIPI